MKEATGTSNAMLIQEFLQRKGVSRSMKQSPFMAELLKDGHSRLPGLVTLNPLTHSS
jgi:hypothetical protein